jgi:hypothetical protein
MIDFPASPAIGDTYTSGGSTWKWDGTKWISVGSKAAIYIGDTPPSSPSAGALWWDRVGGQLYIYYTDANSSQWVIAVNYGFGLFLPVAGGTLTGPLTLAADPVAPLQPATKQYVDAHANSNRIINGDMKIDQRNSGATITPTTSVYTVDRWTCGLTQASKLSFARYAGGAQAIALGLNYSLLMTTAAAFTPATTDAFYVYQPVEADNVNDFCWGTANAQSVTLSFWISVNGMTGTFSGSIRNMPTPSTRSYPFSFNYPTAGVWQKIVINIPGDTAGTWVMSGNAGAFQVVFDLGCGATYRGAAGVWTSANLLGVTGAQSPVTVLNTQVFISNVKLELGNNATPFNKQTVSKTLSDCQRYFQVGQLISGGQSGAASQPLYNSSMFSTSMRAGPTVTPTATSYNNCTLAAAGAYGPNSIWVQATSVAAGSFNAVTSFTANAEL